MISRSGARTATILSLAVAALFFGITGCGNNASGENAAAVGTLASINGSTDLLGTWTLNKEQSDPPPQRPDSVRHWRGRGHRGDFPDSLQGGRQGHRGMRGPVSFTIAQTDSTVSISGPRGRTRTLYTDGRVMTPVNDRAPEGIETRASWNSEGQLVVEHKGPRGGTRTETFALSSDGKQLIITTHADPAGDREPRAFRRVYDAASSGS